jgi:hypothetical protein
MKTSEVVKVTFVGGPRHGECVEMRNPPEQIPAQSASGAQVFYEAHSWYGPGRAPVFTHDTYTVAGLTYDEHFH